MLYPMNWHYELTKKRAEFSGRVKCGQIEILFVVNHNDHVVLFALLIVTYQNDFIQPR